MNKMIVALLLAASLGASATASAQEPSLISNGGFESGTASWTAGSAVQLSSSGHSGMFSAAASCRPGITTACFSPSSPNYLMQSIPSVPDTAYTLSFWARTSTDVETGQIRFNWNGIALPDQRVQFTHREWNLYTFSGLVATDHSTELKIFLANNRSGALTFIDDIAIDGLAPTVPQVPEPGAAAMLLAGLGLLGYVARRRARAAQSSQPAIA